MAIEQPAQPLECFALAGIGLTPLLLADLVDGLIECFHDMKAIEYQFGVAAMITNGAHVGFAHVAAGRVNLRPLIGTEHLIEKSVDGFAAASLTDPNDHGPLQIVNQRRVTVALVIRNLVNTDDPQSADTMAGATACDAAVQLLGQRRGRQAQQFGRRFLRHRLAQAQNRVFQPRGDARMGRRPGNLLFAPPVGRADDLTREIHQGHLPAGNRQITPLPRDRSGADDLSASATIGATRAVLVGFDAETQRSVTTVLKVRHLQDLVQLEQFRDSLVRGHGSLRSAI